MRKITQTILSLVFVFCSLWLTAQTTYTENFDVDGNWTSGSGYIPRAYVNDVDNPENDGFESNAVYRDGTTDYSWRLEGTADTYFRYRCSETVQSISAQIAIWNKDVETKVYLRYSTDGGLNYTKVDSLSNEDFTADQTFIDYSHTFDTPIAPGSGQELYIEFITVSGERMIYDDFSVTYGAASNPNITVTAPAGGETFNVGGSATINWTSNDVTGNVKIAVNVNDGQGFFDVSGEMDVTTETYTLGIPNGAGETDAAVVMVYLVADSANVFGVSPAFSINDEVSPSLEETTPVNNATDVALDAEFSIAFDEDIMAGAGNIIVKNYSDDTTVETIAAVDATVENEMIHFSFSNLDYSTQYYIEVESNAITDLYENAYAGFSGNTTWSFTTEDYVDPCTGVGVLPYAEDFETGLGKLANATGSTDNWVINTSIVQEGNQSVFLDYTANSLDTLIVECPIDLTTATNPQLSFWHIAKTEGGYDKCYVKISVDGGAFEDLPASTYEGNALDYSTEGYFHEDSYDEWGTTDISPENSWWKRETFNLTDYIASNDVKIMFLQTADGGVQRNGWYLDNIQINNIACPNPSGQIATDITANSAVLSWVSGGASNFNIKFGEQGFDFAAASEIAVADTFYNATNLDAQTTYEFYVQDSCGMNDVSEWVGPFEFTTECDVVSQFPWEDSFENGIDCWTILDENNDNDSWTLSTTTGNTGTYCMTLYTDYNTVNNDYLITPQLALTGNQELKFFVKANSSSEYEELKVLLSTTDNQESSFTEEIMATTTIDFTNFTEFSINLSAYTGNVYIAFVRQEAPADGWYLYLDDVTVRDIPTCGEVYDLFADNVTIHEADITWTCPNDAGEWDVKYGHAGFDFDTEGSMFTVNNDTTSLNGLDAETEYEFYVRANCGGGDFSEWTGPYSFTTEIACPVPTNVMIPVEYITESGALISWASTASTFNIEYGLSGFTQGEGTLVEDITSPYSLTGLSNATTYDIYIQANCDAEGYSDWTSAQELTTLCGTVELPWIEEFTSFLPNCWDKQEGVIGNPTSFSGNSGSWISEVFANAGSNESARLNIFGTGTMDWLITPAIELGDGSVDYQLEFDLALTDYSSPNVADMNGDDDKFAVVISTDNGQTWSDANILRLWDNDASEYVYNNIATAGEHITISLAGYTGEVKIAFYGESTLSNADNNIYVDNVEVKEAPTCLVPTDLFADNVTIHEADITWTCPNDAGEWDVKYGYAGFDFDTEGSMFTVNNDTTSLNGLDADTEYEFYVRANCGGGDFSEWTGPYSFATEIACPEPTGILVENITETEAQLSWTSTAGAFNIEYGPAGFTQGEGTLVEDVTSPYDLTGLSNATTYDVYVQANCDADGYSNWASQQFMTLCGTVQGDVMAEAIVINNLPATIQGETNTCYTDDYISSDAADIYYQFTTSACAESVTIGLCNSEFDTKLYLLDDQGNLVTSNDDGCSGTNRSLIDNQAIDGSTTYIIVVDGYHTYSEGAYELTVEETIADPSFDYANTTYYKNQAINPVANITGTTGGTFSAIPNDLVWADQATGEIDLAQTPANTYTITYELSATCSETFEVTIEEALPLNLVINEVHADAPGDDYTEFLELYDGGIGNTDLTGYLIVLYNGSNDESYAAYDLTGKTTDAYGYFVLGNDTVEGQETRIANNTGMAFFNENHQIQNGADGIGLYQDVAANIPNGTAVTATNLIDAIVYGTDDSDATGLMSVLLNANEPQVNDNADESMQRIPNGEGGARNTSSYMSVVPTPGEENTVPREVVWNETIFAEDAGNDGSIANELPITLNYDTYAVTGMLTEGTHYNANNIPAGLTLEITVNSTADTAFAALTGMADAHADIDDVNNLMISFQPEAFTSGETLIMAMNNNLEVDFLDPYPVYDVVVLQPEDGMVHNMCDVSTSIPVQIQIGNIGDDAIMTGDSIFVGYQINSEAWVNDTIELTFDLDPGSNMDYAFTTLADITALGTYDINIVAFHKEGINHNNDTVSITVNHIEVDVNIAQGDTVELNQYQLPYDLHVNEMDYDYYEWGQDVNNLSQEGANYQATQFGWYYVRAYYDDSNCEAMDSIFIEEVPLANIDIAVTEPTSGDFSGCDLTTEEEISMMIQNVGTDAIPANDSIYVSYQINGGAIVNDTIFLAADLNAGEEIEFLFDETVDMSAMITYNFMFAAVYDEDVNTTNDTVQGSFTHIEMDVEIAQGDTIYVDNNEFPVELSTVDTYDWYNWMDENMNGISNQQTVNVNNFGWYYVDAGMFMADCSPRDSIFIAEANPAELVWSTTTFTEALANDGSIATTINIELLNETFTINTGTYQEGLHYNVSNVPAGLTLVITALSDTEAKIELTGNADAHEDINDISDLTIAFQDAVYAGGSAMDVIASMQNDIAIDFNDAVLPNIDIAVTMPEQGAEYYQCEMTGQDTVVIFFENVGEMTIPMGEKIYTNYQIDGGAIVEDSVILESDLAVNDGMMFEFDQTTDFSAYQTYNFKVFVNYANDINNDNDTVTGSLTHYEPVVEIANAVNDTILIEPNELPYSLSTVATYDIYTWYDVDMNVLGTNATYDAQDEAWYYVMAEDTNGCEAIDSVFLDVNYQRVLAYTSTTFTEDVMNDGSISNTLEATLTYDEFTTVGLFTEGVEFDVANVPAGLQVQVSATDATTLAIELTGNATAHEVADNISDLTITFNDAAFVEGDAASVTGYMENTIAVEYLDAYEVPSIVITEIMYNSPESGTDSLEFVELYNAGDAQVDLSGYYFAEGFVYTFPEGVTIDAGSYVLVAVDSMAMLNTFGVNAYQWEDGGLSNGGEDIALNTWWDVQVDIVDYSDSGDWTAQADGNGTSLVLCDINADNNMGINWSASEVLVGQNGEGNDIFASPGADDTACEFTDLAIVEPVSDDYVDCYLTDQDTIFVTVANSGYTTIVNGEQINVTYQIDANTPVSQAFTLSADLMPGEEVEFEFTQTADFSALTTYNWEFFLEYTGDQDAENDTVRGTLEHYIPVVEIDADDTVTVGADNLPLTLSLTETFMSYTWFDADEAVIGTDATVEVNETGWYYIMVEDDNYCEAYDSVYVDVISDIATIENTSLEVYPNPSKDVFNVVFSSSASANVTIQLVDVTGKVIYTENTENVTEVKTVINVSDITTGAYYLRLINNNTIETRKLIVQ